MGLAGGSVGQRMVGLFYLSRRALSQRTQLPNTASLIVCGMPVALPYLRSPFTPRHGVGRSANAVEGSAPIGAGARAVNLDGARGRQLRLIFDPIRGPND